ncbi:MAG: hypothetical protein ABEJ06_03745 [Haloarculaceae archaeon]
MSSALGVRRLYGESLPVAVALSFWVVLSWFGGAPGVARGLRLAGVVMALLYVVVRGRAIARSQPPTPQPTDVAGVLSENLRVLAAAGGWFLAALVAALVDPYWRVVGLPGLFASPVDSLVFVLSGTGVGTVLLYALAVGLPRLRSEAVDADRADPTSQPTE